MKECTAGSSRIHLAARITTDEHDEEQPESPRRAGTTCAEVTVFVATI